MKNVKTILAVSLIAFGVSGAAMAQKAPMTADGNVPAGKLIGMSVFNEKHEKIGTVDEILLPSKGGDVTAVLSVGQFTGGGVKYIRVPLGHVTLSGATPMMPGDKAALLAMPSYWQNLPTVAN